MRLLTIVGIVGDTHDMASMRRRVRPFYVNLFQRPRAAITLTMLSDADLRSVTSPGESCRTQPGDSGGFRTLSQVYSASLGSRRFNVMLIGSSESPHCCSQPRGVWRDGLFRQPPHARNRRAYRSRGGLRRRADDDSGPGMRTIFIGVAIGIAGSLTLTRTVESCSFG